MALEKITIPDIGDFDKVEIIEVLINVGDAVNVDDTLITLESDKASMEIPSTKTGVIKEVYFNVGDKVGHGDEIAQIETTEEVNNQAKETNSDSIEEVDNQAKETNSDSINDNVVEQTNTTDVKLNIAKHNNYDSHTSPAIRKLARELGVDLTKIKGTAAKGRVTDKDLKSFVKSIVQKSDSNQFNNIPTIPNIDFSQFGEITEVPLSRINKISASHLHSCWLNAVHVTQFGEANIDEIELFREIQKNKNNKMTPLVFIIKAVIHCLKKYPKFNSSLSGDKIIMKKYFNIGIAVDTENGLVVPVIHDANKKSLTELQQELVDLAKKARANKLTNKDLSGGCFSISSLGGIGGKEFTPIINVPEVAILGVAKSQIKPYWNGKEFIPKTVLPLALSYDHRVVDGALGAKFITTLSQTLTDIREVLL